MPERREIAATARQMLGRMAFVTFREYGLLARLLGPGEDIEAMVLGRLKGGGLVGAQRLVVATSDRLLFVEKGFITGRERIEDHAWDAVRSVSVGAPDRLSVELRDGRVELAWVQPPRQLGAVAEAIGRRLDPSSAERLSTAELLDLARSRLGRMLGMSVTPNVVSLAAALEASESVLDLAWASQKPDGLLAATDRRLLFVPSTRFGGAEEPLSLPYETLAAISLDEEGTVIADDHRWSVVTPPERAQALVQRVAARLPS